MNQEYEQLNDKFTKAKEDLLDFEKETANTLGDNELTPEAIAKTESDRKKFEE
jgi:hypothetical protein